MGDLQATTVDVLSMRFRSELPILGIEFYKALHHSQIGIIRNRCHVTAVVATCHGFLCVTRLSHYLRMFLDVEHCWKCANPTTSLKLSPKFVDARSGEMDVELYFAIG